MPNGVHQMRHVRFLFSPEKHRYPTVPNVANGFSKILQFAKIGLDCFHDDLLQSRAMTRPVDNLLETRAGDVLQRMRGDIIACALKPGARLRFEALRDKYEASFS